ncbi:Superoxide dismutase [Mn], mitochondrial [Puccinia graminis f. sp. tritici]|uniref:Superoxide dismutase [Mn], mitochondrial n=1 Tax=Puccinia graminis f. sp. tritici TaxID=56615 RepID=A0A5B0SGT3_PUCGR|nr:Superoxide dismutase [Mn], mitochondrial [Puccinia graminis f. sp. tritici]KAA1137181.1 Superoxide dismutase [Mn], mitochondrial [Puccinia graminis f. sp. tritici]
MRFSALYPDSRIGCLFYSLCVNALLIQSSPTSSLEEKTLVSSWSRFEDNSFFELGKRNTLTPPHHHQFLSEKHFADSVISQSLDRRNVSAQKVSLTNSLKTGTGSDLASASKKMYRIYTNVNSVYLAITLIPAFIICYGSFSSFLRERLYLSDAMLAVSFGVLMGPHVAGLIDPRSWGGGASFNEITLEITRIIVALDVFSAGVELPAAYILRHWQTMICLLGPVVLAGWFISGAFIILLVPALSYLEALVIAACVCPTDILLASSVVGNGRYAQKHVPPHLRHLLQAEAGANDGVAIILLYFTLFLLLRNNYSVGHAIGDWLLLGVLYHILVGIIMGAVAGIIARETLKFSKRKELIDKESMVAMYIALALMTAGVAILAGADDIMAAFACGTAFAWDHWFSEEIEASNFSQILSHLVNTSAFIYVGATIPFELWNEAALTLTGWKMVLLALSILLLRRLPVMILLRKLIPDLKTNKEAVFCGHFGPIGVSGLFISILATEKLPTPQIPARSSLDVLALTIQPIMYLLLCFSVFIHGLSVPFFNLGKNFGSRVNSLRRSGTFTSSIRSGRFNNFTRYDPTNIDHGVGTLQTEQQSLVASPPPSPTPTINSRAAYNRSIAISQITHVDVDCDSDAEETKGTHHNLNNPETQSLLKNQEKMPDGWVEPQPVQAANGTTMYKCGTHLIVERSDGKELEVWRLQPASVDKALGPAPLPGPSESSISRNLEGIGARSHLSDFCAQSASLVQLLPPAELNKNEKSTTHATSKDCPPVPGKVSGQRGLGGPQVSKEMDPTTSSSRAVDSEGESDEWVEDDQPALKRTTRPKSSRIRLRPRKFTSRPKRRMSCNSLKLADPMDKNRTLRDGSRTSMEQKLGSARSPSRTTSPAGRSIGGRSHKISAHRRSTLIKAETDAPFNQLTLAAKPNDEDTDKRKPFPIKESSRPPSPNLKNKGAEQVEARSRKRQGSQSQADPNRRVSFVDPSQR